MECTYCETDIDELVNFDTLSSDYIVCPTCKGKLVVEHDICCDGADEFHMWSVAPYEGGL